MNSEKMIAYMKKSKVVGAMMLVLLCTLCSGCTLNPKSVKLHTKKEILQKANEWYGNAEVIDVKESDEPYQRVFTLRDKDYGFTYEMISHPKSEGMDGSVFYYSGASVYSGYQDAFLEYFNKTEKDAFERQGIKLTDDLKYKLYCSDKRMFSLKDYQLVSTPEQWRDDMNFAWERMHAYKNIESVFGPCKIEVSKYDHREYYGTLKEEGFITAQDEKIEYYMREARYLAGISDIKYVRTEEKNIKDIPELADQNFYEQRLQDGDGKVNVYYFSYEGKEYFIIDEWVAQINENGGGMFQYYQNYKHYDVSK